MIDMNGDIQKVNQEEQASVWGVINSASEKLADEGLHHWKDYYTEKVVADKFSSGEVFLFKQNNIAIGTFTLSTKIPSEYDLQFFTEPENTKVVYLSAFAVHSEFQGKGIASFLIEYIKQYAKEQGYEYIRFDARADYKVLIDFYKRHEFEVVGRIYDKDDNDREYYLFELAL